MYQPVAELDGKGGGGVSRAVVAVGWGGSNAGHCVHCVQRMCVYGFMFIEMTNSSRERRLISHPHGFREAVLTLLLDHKGTQAVPP